MKPSLVWFCLILLHIRIAFTIFFLYADVTVIIGMICQVNEGCHLTVVSIMFTRGIGVAEFYAYGIKNSFCKQCIGLIHAHVHTSSGNLIKTAFYC